MLDAVEIQIQLVGVPLGVAELTPVVGEHGLDVQLALPIERQYVVVQDRHGGLGLLGDMQEGEGVRAVGIDDRMQVDLTHPLEAADKERVG